MLLHADKQSHCCEAHCLAHSPQRRRASSGQRSTGTWPPVTPPRLHPIVYSLFQGSEAAGSSASGASRSRTVRRGDAGLQQPTPALQRAHASQRAVGPYARPCARGAWQRYASLLQPPPLRPRFLGLGALRRQSGGASGPLTSLMQRGQLRRAAWAAALLLAVLLQAVGPASAAAASRRTNCGGGRRLRQESGRSTPSPGACPAAPATSALLLDLLVCNGAGLLVAWCICRFQARLRRCATLV